MLHSGFFIFRGTVWLTLLSLSVFAIGFGCASSSSDESDAVNESPADDGNGPIATVEVRNSAAVAFQYSGASVERWLDSPSSAYIQGYFRFPSDLANDVFMGFDIEFLEGVDSPIRFEGADWMALVGITREGILFVPVGTESSLAGVPSDADVVQQPLLATSLKPDTWYRMRIDVDFGELKFIAVTIEGGDIFERVQLSQLYVDYPNYLPFDGRSLTFFFFALRAQQLAEDELGSTTVYFDDVSGGIGTPNGEIVVFRNSCEEDGAITDLPVTLPIIPLSNFVEGAWYKENENALVSYRPLLGRNNSTACVGDASLIVR